MSKFPILGLHSPPDSNAQKDNENDSELSDLEMEVPSLSEAKIKLEPDHMRDGVPVFTPNMAQFHDFEKFITAVNPWGMTHGIVKVIPPKEWLDEQPPLHEEVKKIKIKNPYIQEMNNQGSRGASGNFRQLNLSSNRTYNIVEWRALCNQLSRQPPAKRGETRRAPEKPANISKRKSELSRVCDESESGLGGKSAKITTSKKARPKEEEEVSVNSRRNKYREENSVIDEEAFKDFDYNLYEEFDDERCQDLEVAYWKHISYAPPMYGGDMPGTLFTDKTKVWDLRNLPGFLNYLDEKVPGINTTYLYIGSWKSTFSWHLEDVDLYSINYLHFGAPKQWYSISQADRERFEKAMASKWPEEFKDCNQFLRHKTFQISPAALWKDFKIKVNKIVHRPGEFMITFPYGYHAGYNLGYNCAEAVNFAVDEWIPIAEKAKRCDCAQQQDSVWVDLDSIRRKLPPTHKWYLASLDEDDDYFDDTEDDGHSPDILTPPHSGSEVKVPTPRKRKTCVKKPEGRQVKRRVAVKPLEEPPCILCPNSNFELIETDTGKRAHRICGEYIPETSVIDGVVRDTKFISKARMGLKCIYCRSKRGACFQCSAAKCTRAYHATCAAASGVFVQKVWMSSFSQDRTEYKQEVYDFRCRFHRPKRDKNIDETTLSMDDKIRQFALGLKIGDICQVQFLCSDIFAGIVVANNHMEDMIRLKVLFDNTNTHYEIEYKWLLVPPLETFLPKPSVNAIPMPTSFKAKENLNTCKRKLDDTPISRDPFGDNLTWAEFLSMPIDPNPDQVKIDLVKKYQIWYYIGEISTETKAHYTDDVKRPWDNPKGNFLNTVPKPASNISRNSCGASHLTNRPGRSSTPRSSCSALNLAGIEKMPVLKMRNKHSRSKLAISKKTIQPSLDVSKQRNEKFSRAESPQNLNGSQIASASQVLTLNKTTYTRNLSSLPSPLTPTNHKRQSSLVLTQPNWPPISPANSNLSGLHGHLTQIGTSLSSSAFLIKQENQHPAKSSSPSHHKKLISTITNGKRSSKSMSTIIPFMKYKYLQVEHNKDKGNYKSPYRVGGGFMNGYEKFTECSRKHSGKICLNGTALAPSSSSICSTLSSPFEENLRPAIRQPNYRDEISSPNSETKCYNNSGPDLSSLLDNCRSSPDFGPQMKTVTITKPTSQMATVPPARKYDVTCLNYNTNKDWSHRVESSNAAHRLSKKNIVTQHTQGNELNVTVSCPQVGHQEKNLSSGPQKNGNPYRLRDDDNYILKKKDENQAKILEPSMMLLKQDQILNDPIRTSKVRISTSQSSHLPSRLSLSQLHKQTQQHSSSYAQPNIPDVPPDTSTIIEKMMSNLKKARSEVWNNSI